MFDYEEGQVLISLDTDPVFGNVTFRTVWIADKLVRQGGSDSLVFKGGKQLTTMSWENMEEDRYFMVAHATLEMQNGNGETVRLDMSNALPGQPLAVLDEPYVKEVDEAAKIFAGVIIGVTGLATLGMFCFIIVHRNHKIMTMAQAGLLAFLALACMITISLSFLLLPINDVFCQLQELLFIFATLMPTILIGRLWRVYTTLSVAHKLGRGVQGSSSLNAQSSKLDSVKQRTSAKLNKISNFSEDKIMKLLSLIACTPCVQRVEKRTSSPGMRRATSSLRRATTRVETLLLIFFLTLPQIVVQLVGIFAYGKTLEVTFNDDFTAARKYCQPPENGSWILLFGSIYLAFMFVVATYVAWCSRNLPSAFNEKDAVFKASFLSGIMVVVISLGLSFSNIPEVAPNVSASLEILMTVGVSTITAYFVITPKIRRVRSGEPVVMTNILRDMNGLGSVSSASSSTEEDEYRRASEEATRAHRRATETKSSQLDATGSPKRHVTTQPVEIRYDQPIPKKMEKHLYKLICNESMVRTRRLYCWTIDRNVIHIPSLTYHCYFPLLYSAEGRPMDKREWRSLLKATNELAFEFDNVSMKFESEAEMSASMGGEKETDPEQQPDHSE
ncbi:MAG: hypothetical protein SGARI_002413 [Bacillariaceae sp.]